MLGFFKNRILDRKNEQASLLGSNERVAGRKAVSNVLNRLIERAFERHSFLTGKLVLIDQEREKSNITEERLIQLTNIKHEYLSEMEMLYVRMRSMRDELLIRSDELALVLEEECLKIMALADPNWNLPDEPDRFADSQ